MSFCIINSNDNIYKNVSQRKTKMNKVPAIYNVLLNSLGPQGWWPITSSANQHGFDSRGYHHNNFQPPESDEAMFEIFVGAILTQNTAWTNVEKAILVLKSKNVINISVMNKLPKSRLAKLIRSAGYFNQKADRLKGIADYLVKEYNSNLSLLFDKPVDVLRAELLSLKGIGPETADSIILYAAKKPSFVIDTYTKRIFSRVGLCAKDVSYDALQVLVHQNLKKDVVFFNEYHALLVELAKQYCTKRNPVCGSCPITKMCKKVL